MFAYILRRLGALVVILLGSSFLIYNLAAISTDPLEGLKTSTAQNRAVDCIGNKRAQIGSATATALFPLASWRAGNFCWKS